ncbi:MAG: hypothetical protein RO257_13905 [Candidatus Kapabacteria bacterium]|nr:hypothetical protein [Candidatus Kapabacteria bacterium]
MFRNSLFAVLFIISTVSLFSQEQVSLDLTIYSNNFGVIRDVRSFNLNKGISDLKFSGIPATINPQSIFLKFDGQILEQSFRNDIENRNIFFNKLLNRKLTLKKADNEIIKGELLSFNDGFMIKTESGEITMVPDIIDYQVSSLDLPKDLVTAPTIFWKLNSAKEGSQNLAINYLFDGITWRADYVAILNENETQMDIDAKFSLTNNSGFAIKNAAANLISGKVNKSIVQSKSYDRNTYMEIKGMSADGMMNQEVAAEDMSDYQLYNLSSPLNLDNNETKQLGMFIANNVKIVRKKRFSAYGTGSQGPVNSIISFHNNEQSGLGKLLPQGKMSFYKNRNNKPEFIGESQIGVKNIGDSLELYIGDVAGITAAHHALNSSKTENYIENEMEIVLTNRTDKDEDVEIYIYKGYLGTITKPSVKLFKIDAKLERCTVKVPKKADFKMTYTLRNMIQK